MAHQEAMRKRLLITALVALGLALPLAAQSTVPATGEILPGWTRADGSRVAAIRIKLAPGWKTYWRSPGDAGIPPQFDWSGSGNLRGLDVTWPAPRIYPQNGMQTIGYKDELVLPLIIAPRKSGKPVKLRAQMDLGVCKDICMPFNLSLKATLSESTTKPTPAIAAALAARPYSASEAGVRAATCGLRPTEDGLEIKATLRMPATGGREVVVIEPGQPDLWMSQTDVARKGGTLVATGDIVPPRGKAVVLDRSAIVITVIGQKQVVEIKGCKAP